MSNMSLFNSTMKTNIVLYRSNGKGRDSYISYNSGGFWKNKNPINIKEHYYPTPFGIYHSWNRKPPIWIYHSDGTGRDSYVSYDNGGFIKKFNSMSNYCKNFLWLNNEEKKSENYKKKIKLTRGEILYFQKINKIQKDLVNRLYNQRNLRKKIIIKDKIKINANNSNDISFSFDLKKNKNNTLIKSSSQILEKKQLNSIQCYNSYDNHNRKLMLNNRFNSNSMRNMLKKNMKLNLNKSFYNKKKFIFDIKNNKITTIPKVKCAIESDDNKNN